jgi:hypothetical protein
MRGRQTGGYLATIAFGGIEKVTARHMPCAVPLRLFTSHVLASRNLVSDGAIYPSDRTGRRA